MKLTKAQIKGKQEALVHGRLRATVLSVAIVANVKMLPIGNIDIDNWQHFHIGNIQQGRPPRAACPPPFGHDRSADTKSPFGQHENACVAGVTKWRGRQKFLGRNHLRQGCGGQEDCKGMTLFEPALFASPAERAISCGPKGPFVSGGAAWPDRAQGRCNADGEAKPQAVRRRAFLEVVARRPAARRFSWLRASASLPCAQAPAAPGGAHRHPRGQHGATPQPARFNPRGYSGPDPRGSSTKKKTGDSN